ncbi:MAG: hypothetical protein ACXWQ5_05020 [Ktedonobacterales bacterium]
MSRPSLLRRRAVVSCASDAYQFADTTPPAQDAPVQALAALWPVLVGLWILAAAATAGLYALDGYERSMGNASGLMAFVRSAWETLRAWSVQPPLVAVIGVVLALALTWYAGMARWVVGMRQRRLYAAEYVLRAVRYVSGADYVPRYVRQVYLARVDAVTGGNLDRAAREAIHAASRRPRSSSLAPLGVCVVGAAMQGKTRLAWEALQATLPGWTLLRWPHEPRQVFGFEGVRGKRFVLWLDNMHEFATPTRGTALVDMPRRLVEAGARVVVVATCRDGRDERRVRRHLGSMLERLTVVRLGNISVSEANQLATALAKAGVTVERDQFDGTPGSLLLGLKRMRRTDFPTLPKEAQDVLQALSVLRSAQIYRYPLSRVLAVAIDLFGAGTLELGEACATLERRGWLRAPVTRDMGERELVPVSGVYIEQGVRDYLNPNAELSDDWPWLMAILERRRDVVALRRLGNTFTELVKGVGPLLPYDVGTFRDQGITCLRAALQCCSPHKDPQLWAVTQLDLGYSLAARAEVATGVARADLWRQAIAAYRAALDALPVGSSPAYGALARIRLAEIAHQQAGDALYGGDIRTACGHLTVALEHVACAQTFYTPETDPERHRTTVALRSAIETTQYDLNCDIESCDCE